MGGFQLFGNEPAFLARLEITYVESDVKTIITDGTWKSHDSPILSSDFMLSEVYDAGGESEGRGLAGLG